MKQRLIALILILAMVLGSTSVVFGATQDVSDATTHTRLSTIITWLNNSAPTYNLVNLLNNNILDIKDAIVWNSGESTNNIIYFVRNISNGIDSIATSLSSSGGSSIANILDNILTELTWTNSGGTVIHGIQTIMTYISNIRTYTNNIQSYTNTINQNVAAIGTEILSSFPATVQQLTALNTKTQNIYTLENNTLPGIYAYAGSIDGTTTAINDLQQVQLPKLEDLRLALTNIDPQISSSYYPTWVSMRTNAHTNLLVVSDPNGTGTKRTGEYYIPTVSAFGVYDSLGSIFNWKNGSPLGNIALLLQKSILNNAQIYRYSWTSGLTGFNTAQSVYNWDTATSISYTPISAIDGIYKFLNGMQTPLAKLAFIHANNDDIQAMKNAQASGVDAMKADIYDSNNGGVKLSDMTDTFNTGKSARNAFNTGVSYSTNGLFSFTDNGNWGFWSNDAKNDMDTVASIRSLSKNNQFDTSAYDDRLESLESIWGLDYNGK